MRRPWPSTAVPPSRLDAPETTSAVSGDFQEPYGAVILSCVAEYVSGTGLVEAIILQPRCFCLLGDAVKTVLLLKIYLKLMLAEDEEAEKRVRVVMAESSEIAISFYNWLLNLNQRYRVCGRTLSWNNCHRLIWGYQTISLHPDSRFPINNNLPHWCEQASNTVVMVNALHLRTDGLLMK